MPIFEYKCKNCNETIEVFQRSHSNGLLDVLNGECKCSCGNWEPIKRISKSSFELKGEGWAKDGYHKKGITI